MKLIKINEEHYIVVDDSEIKEGDYCYNIKHSRPFQIGRIEGVEKNDKKITHSTQPLDERNGGLDFIVQGILELSLQEVKELIGEVDVEKKAREEVERYMISTSSIDLKAKIQRFQGYMKGYNQAIEDNKEKKYTEDEIRNVMMMAWINGQANSDCHYSVREQWIEKNIRHLQPETSWEVEIVDGKLKLI